MNVKIDKPWGHELIWAQETFYAAKIIYIKKGHQLSLQKHARRFENIYILSGVMRLHIRNDIRIMTPGESAHIGPAVEHRFEAIEDTELVEVSTPEVNDVIRLKDDYDRV